MYVYAQLDTYIHLHARMHTCTHLESALTEETIYGSRTLRDEEDVERLAEAYVDSIQGRGSNYEPNL